MARISKLRLQPMLATLIDEPFDNPGWVFESKWDGFRMVASIEGGKVTLYSRNGEIVSDRYLPVAKALEAIDYDAVIDGELVVLDAQGSAKAGEEGILAKRADSTYVSGERSKSWLKIKTDKRQEVVIVGFTEPRRSRKYFGALVIALRDGKQWRYAGHVGTGFSHAMLEMLYVKLWPLRKAKSPFPHRVKDEAVTTWVRPKLIAEVKFTEWTSAGEMRHLSFLDLRQDKKPKTWSSNKSRGPPSDPLPPQNRVYGYATELATGKPSGSITLNTSRILAMLPLRAQATRRLVSGHVPIVSRAFICTSGGILHATIAYLVSVRCSVT